MVELISPLLRAFAHAIAPGKTIEVGGGGVAVAQDTIHLDEMLTGAGPETLSRLWVNDRSLITTRRFSREPMFARARGVSEANGWPVHVRSSGGTTVVHRPGILNVSLLRRVTRTGSDIDQAFRPLMDLLVKACRMFGLDATTGLLPGCYCDGRFNLLVEGRKVAGTACLIRRSADFIVQLSHAMIWVEGDIAEDIAAIARFEGELGLVPRYDLGVHATLEAMALSAQMRPMLGSAV